MRTVLLLPLLFACSSDAVPSDPSPSGDTPSTEPSEGTTTLSQDTAPTDTAPSDTALPTDTANDSGILVGVTVAGEATITDATWDGTERLLFTNLRDGATVCEYVYTTTDWVRAGQTAAAPASGFDCEDYDGNPCDFAFDVVSHDGVDAQTGPGCAAFSFADSSHTGLGYHSDYHALGSSYGPALMYLLDYALIDPAKPTGVYVYWLGLAVPVAFDGSLLTYELEYGATSYTP